MIDNTYMPGAVDFYPTPPSLIAKMLDGIDFGEVDTILEPGAGRADICDYIVGKSEKDYSYHSRRKPKIDVIEIDPTCQNILKGKGYRLVHDDFLTFETYKSYDLIIANFPFSEGDRHLEKALTLLMRGGGQLRCLVNAETLRNPYTNLRKAIVQYLDRFGAEVEYLEGEFLQADRPTDVEVALIKLTVEPNTGVSLILDTLQKAEVPPASEYEDAAPLIERDFKKAIVARFNMECKVGVKLIDEYFALAPHITNRIVRPGKEDYSSPLIELKIANAYSGRASHVNAYLAGVREKYWQVLICDERFTANYTSNILSELRDKLTELRDYDFSLFNIAELEKELRSKIVDGIEASILNLFDTFTRKYAWDESIHEGNVHYYNGWKTNKAHKVSKKIIIPLHGFSAWSRTLDYSAHDKLRDMVKVFNYLEEVELRTDVPRLVESALGNADRQRHYAGIDLRYFEVSLYKKGTCHVKFTRPDLLDKFNIFGSQRKGWLPPAYGRKPYDAMDSEEREIVDSFQGREKYSEVFARRDFYLVETSQLLLAD